MSIKYLIKPGNIASVVHVIPGSTDPGFDCHYVSDEKGAAICNLRDPDYTKGIVEYNKLPIELRQAIDAHYKSLFSLPLEKRVIKKTRPMIEVECYERQSS